MAAAAHFIYADEMTSLMHGYPLWEPECHPEVSIADVGYIRRGRFCRLFNASLPAGHPQNEFGVPEGYEQLIVDERAMVERRLPPGPMVSRSITKCGAEIELTGSILEAGAGFEFSCAKDRGAVLIINSDARRKDSEQRGAFKRYMLKHYKSWVSFANDEPQFRDISLSDLVFVTGRDNTADWAVAAFSERAVSGGVYFEAGYPSIAGAKFSIWGSWKGLRSVHHHCGPQIPRSPVEHGASAGGVTPPPSDVCAADLQAYDQCVFIRGFRVMGRASQVRQSIGLKVPGGSGGLETLQRPWIARNFSSEPGTESKRRSSSGGSWGKQHTQSTEQSTEDKSADSMQVEIVANEPRACAPVELLLAYILEQSSEAALAVAHDDDMAAIVNSNSESYDFGDLLRKVAPLVVVDSQGVGTISLDEEPRTPPMKKDRGQDKKAPPSTPPAKPDYPEPPEKTIPPSGTSPCPNCGRGKSEKPDSTAYHVKQEGIKTQFNLLQVQLTQVKRQIALVSKTGPGADRQTALRAELDSLRDQQLGNKVSREKAAAQLKQLQEETRVKIKELQSLAKKLPARTIDELESQTRTLDRRVEAGGISLSEEKKIVAQISNLRRSRTAVEFYQTLQATVEANRAQADDLRKQLDSGPKALSVRFDAVRAELDMHRRERDEAVANRGELYRERDELQQQISALHEQRRQSAEQFRVSNEAYWQKQNEGRAQEAERVRAEKSAQEERRRAEARERLLDKARVPAFAAEIQDCRNLLEYFSGKADHTLTPSLTTAVAKRQGSNQEPWLAGENHPGPDWVPLKKKGGEEDTFFVSGKGKAKKSRGRGVPAGGTAKISIPLGIMSTLLSLAITPPTTTADVPRTVADLQEKIEWFQVNQERVTEENVARVEAELHRIGPISRTSSLSISV